MYWAIHLSVCSRRSLPSSWIWWFCCVFFSCFGPKCSAYFVSEHSYTRPSHLVPLVGLICFLRPEHIRGGVRSHQIHFRESESAEGNQRNLHSFHVCHWHVQYRGKLKNGCRWGLNLFFLVFCASQKFLRRTIIQPPMVSSVVVVVVVVVRVQIKKWITF